MLQMISDASHDVTVFILWSFINIALVEIVAINIFTNL